MFLSTHLQKCARVLSNVKKSVQRKGKLKLSTLEIFVVAGFIYDTRPLSADGLRRARPKTFADAFPALLWPFYENKSWPILSFALIDENYPLDFQRVDKYR